MLKKLRIKCKLSKMEAAAILEIPVLIYAWIEAHPLSSNYIHYATLKEYYKNLVSK